VVCLNSFIGSSVWLPAHPDNSVLQNLATMGGGLEGGNHHEHEGVQKPSRRLRTFQAASYTPDTSYVAANCPAVPSV